MIGGDRDWINFLAKSKFALSTSRADRSDPSPNLFSDPKGGNSHSIKGQLFFLGELKARWMEDIALESRSLVELGIFGADEPPKIMESAEDAVREDPWLGQKASQQEAVKKKAKMSLAIMVSTVDSCLILSDTKILRCILCRTSFIFVS